MKNSYLAGSIVSLAIVLLLLVPGISSGVVDINSYCNVPPFVSQSVPPLVMLVSGRDHKWYYEAYNDAMDLDEDGRLDVGYMHNLVYYGYFDAFKCYTYVNNTGLFTPASVNTDKFCAAGQWSGNILNWLTMSRMDVLRKVLYGGHRSTDSTTSTILERVYIPGDAHSWGKEVTGRLCKNGDVYKNTCYNNDDCTANGSGFTCVDKSINLIGVAAATNSACPAKTVTWSTPSMLVARYTQPGGGDSNGSSHQQLLDSFYTDNGGNRVVPLTLLDMNAANNPTGASTKITYVTSFADTALDPRKVQQNNTDTIVVAEFKTPASSAGVWQFAIDGDDGVELELSATKNGAGNIVASYYGGHSSCFDTTKNPMEDPTNKAFCDATRQASNINTLLTPIAATPNVCSAKTTYTCDPVSGLITSATNKNKLCNAAGVDVGYCVRNLAETTLAASTKYYIYARQANGVGNGGIKIWYKKPKDAAWRIFDNSELVFASPTIVSGNECAIKFSAFVDLAVTTTGDNYRHLFCGTTLAVAGTPLLRMLTNRLERAWSWASKERPVCANVIRNVADNGDTALTVDDNKADTTKIWDYTNRIEVCKSNPGLEANCRAYKDASGTTTYKPAGLLQKYGEGDGAKVCSKTFTKPCTTDANCTAATEGLCIDRAPMFFGLITGSYLKNESGGMLRKDVWSLSDEINMSTGQFTQPASWSSTDYATKYPQGSIIQTFEQLRTVGFRWLDDNGAAVYSYSDSTSATNNGGVCGWITNYPLGEGKCRMWGNPIAEMMYEGLRYFAGKTSPTAAFSTMAANAAISQDGALPVFEMNWGIKSGATTYTVYGDDNNANGVFPLCSKPFMLVMSDVNTSYDTDQIPGTKFATFSEDAGVPKLNIDVGTLTDTIGDTEGITGQSVFVGATTTENNFMCTPKTATKLSLIRGLCPEEPTKQGGYYAAAAAYYGHTLMKTNTQKVNNQGLITVPGKSNVTTYSLALTSPVPKMELIVSGNKVTIIPMGKSVSGGGVDSCTSKCTLGNNALGGLTISNCSAAATATVAGSFCPSNQIVDFYVDSVLYDNNNKITYVKFRINFEDVEQGADHDMDAIVTYEICTGNTCSPSIDADQIKISLSSDYAAGGIDQILGFIVSGTSEDGPYLVVRDKDINITAAGTASDFVKALPLTWSHVFTASATPAAKLLENPLWYAAKWGAFTDSNGNNVPDLAGEWDKDGNGVPDNYYLVVNPLKLEQQMDKALSDILNKISSGTAASILSNSEGTGANLLQAVFFPQKTFDSNTSAVWIGELHNLWYYLDPLIDSSTIREDTDYSGTGAHTLNLKNDYVANLYFDTATNQTAVKLYQDIDGNGTGDTFKGVVTPDALKSIWRAGKLLWERNLTSNPRTLKTSTNGSSLLTFSVDNVTALRPYLQATDDAEATNIINYTAGYDISGYRSRTVTIGANSGVWKLGDIVSSTPRITTSLPANAYHQPAPMGYADLSYASFLSSNQYKSRGMAFVGANDGMLHAFKLGTLDVTATGYQKATLSGTDLGSEQWAFIPKNALPYLRYLTDLSYNHLYFVDATSTVADVSIVKAKQPPLIKGGPPVECSGDYWTCPKNNEVVDGSHDLSQDYNNWATILVGGMGLGGATRILGNTCTDCVKTPLTDPNDTALGLGYSSYFALDVTDPTAPSMMWEFTNPTLGYATSGPAIIRVGDSSKNGRWFAVFPSGPTGPIESSSHQFQGKSDQPLKIFVVDLKLGTIIRTIDTLKDGSSLTYAFGGSMAGGAIDTDRWNTASTGNYKDDVVYFGFVSRAGEGTTASPYTWTNGGVLRLNTYDNIDPAQWTLTKIVDGVGPVTTAIARLQDRKNKNLWLYFGTGRYFFKSATAGIDDNSGQRALYGIKEPCYGLTNDMNTAADACENTALTTNDLTNQSTTAIDALTLSKDKGWYINLDPASTTSGAERVVTNTVALTNGAVFFTSFKPTADICGFSGTSFLWATKYNTGYQAPTATLLGKALIQLSTGAFEEVTLGDPTQQINSTFTDREHRRQAVGMQGKPPADAPLIISRSGNKPVKKILHIQEK